MTIYSINTGTSANKGDGDSLRSAFHKINLNFTSLSAIADAVIAPPPSLGDISITNATISTTITNESIVIDPNGTGLVKFRNTAIQFDNGNEGKGGDANGQILYTKGAGSKVGLGVDGSNSSLRIVGDADLLGTLADFGIYNGVGGAWVSKLLVTHTGGFTAQGDANLRSDLNVEGELRAAGGIRFADGSIQSSSVAKLTVSHITSSTTISNRIFDVDTIRFDTESGFSLIDLGQGAVEIAMNSTFKYWDVDGQDSLIAEGLDHVEFIAGPGISITTNHNANPQSITFSATGGNASIGDMLVDSTLFYPSTSTLAVTLSSKEGTSAASFLTLPSLTDTVNPVILSSPNEVRITTEAGSANPITISPNVDGNGPGYVVIGTNGTTSTAGLFAFSAGSGIDFWPNETIADLYSGSDAGTLDLYTSSNNNNISIRPNGVGQVIVTGNIVNRKSVVYSTDAPGAGASANSGNYLTSAVTLDVDKQIQKLASSDYYMPPGQEGQIVYFVPATGAAPTIRVWFQSYRSMMSGTAAVLNNSEWLPFSTSVVGRGPAYAIFTDNAWTTSHGFTS
jgi:hypothetical protein